MAFIGCSGLTSVTLGNSVTSINEYAFYNCSGLTSLTIPNSVTSISNNAFNGCCGLTSIIVNTGNTMYDSRNDCNAIIESETNRLINGCNNTIIPNTVTSIDSFAFWGCSGLTSITIPNSVTSIGERAFQGCSGLTSVTWNAHFNNNFTSSSCPFSNLTNIKSFTIGNEVENIPAYLCYGLSGLNTAIIGENVTSIGSCAFMNCSLLENLVALRERPININSNVFDGIPKASCDLHVRQGSKIRYENQDVWKDFLIILEDAEDWADVGGGSTTTLKGDVNGDGHVNSADVTAIYDILLGNEQEEVINIKYTGFDENNIYLCILHVT